MTKKIETRQLTLANIAVTVHQKKIKHIYLRVKPPLGEVQISAPLYASDNMIEQMVAERAHWIKAQQKIIINRPPLATTDVISGGTVFVFGQAYTLQISSDTVTKTRVELSGNTLLLYSNKHNNAAYRDALHDFYRLLLKEKIPPLLSYWQKQLGVNAKEWRIKRMKTRWGSCNTRAHRVWFNLFLAEHSLECLEYVVLHELAHLLEASHNARFWGIVSKNMPDWKVRQQELNQVR